MLLGASARQNLSALSDFLQILENFGKNIRDLAELGEEVSPFSDSISLRQLTQLTASRIIDGLKKGWAGIEEELDQQAWKVLSENVFVFSGQKSYEELRIITDLLFDESGQIRALNDFLKAVKSVNKLYNQVYLAVEYNHAVAGAQMTRKWQDLTKDPDNYDLMYVAVNDDRTRPSHRIYNGVIRSATDPFWELYYPPNGWRCRCNVRRVRKGQRESAPMPSDANGQDLLPMFRNNIAKRGVLFPEKHPYYPANAALRQRIEDESN